MAKVFPFKFTTTKATEKIQLTVEITKELDFGAKAEEEISFGDFNLKIPAVNLWTQIFLLVHFEAGFTVSFCSYCVFEKFKKVHYCFTMQNESRSSHIWQFKWESRPFKVVSHKSLTCLNNEMAPAHYGQKLALSLLQDTVIDSYHWKCFT